MSSERVLQQGISRIIRATITDTETTAEQREKAAALSRRLADCFKRADPSFSYEWFYGACGLDHWGDAMEPIGVQ